MTREWTLAQLIGMRSINRTPCAEPPNEMRIQVCG